MATQLVLSCLASMAVPGFSFSTFNAARYKPASQSSVYNVHTTAEKAVDGNYDPLFGKSCACTGIDDQAPWWSVDLGREYHVTSVRITNRNYYGYRLHDFTVTVMKDKSATPTVCGQYPGAAADGANVTVTCANLTLGRYVNISKPATESHDLLTLCEVEVMVLNRSRMTFQRLVGKKSSQESGIVSMETTLPDCVHACLHSDSCVGVNYSSGSSQCQLLTTTAHTDVVIYYEWSLYVVMP
ncbi:fucolectin-1-like isoform X2 [Haliotis rubra]|uniref:fucolectin-1-like isoform X2 n=1 Tax=Haliotis rubra TaxID=36100 RepID=UPI001EE520BF|nr:fucolectin-1-like isoform X2 [Haliotis rubra]